MNSIPPTRPPLRRKSGAWRQWPLLMAFAAFPASTLRGEILPHWDPATLTRHSDLVVMGTLGEQSRVTVTRVLKGTTASKELAIPAIDEFSGPLFKQRPPAVSLGREVLLFLDQRSAPPRIVANGYFRLGTRGLQSGVFGYDQLMNPGPYALSPDRKFESFETIASRVKEEISKIPAAQREALEKVKAGIPAGSFHSDLDELCRLTRRGDRDMLQEVSMLDLTFPELDAALLAGLIQEVHDPAALDLLIGLDQRSGHFSMLQAIGALGNPKALEYFKSLLKGDKEPGAYQVLWGLRALYLACEDRGDTATCAQVREEIYREVDKDLPGLMMASPQLISVIPDQGSLDRLQRAYEHHSKLDNNAAYEIARQLAACQKKIAESKPAATPAAEK